MVAQISERRRNANRVDHEGACKRKLCIYRIDKSGCQGTRDTSQGLGRVEESHDKVFLFRIRLICHHILEDRDADGIARINENTEEDENSDIHGDQRSDRRQCTEGGEDDHGLFDIRLFDDPDAETHICDKGYETNACLDNSVVGGSQTKLCL